MATRNLSVINIKRGKEEDKKSGRKNREGLCACVRARACVSEREREREREKLYRSVYLVVSAIFVFAEISRGRIQMKVSFSNNNSLKN